MSSCELNLGDQYMYIYEDSNFGGFCIPNIYIYAHKWLEHQLLGQSLPVSNFHRVLLNAAVSKCLSKMDVFGTSFFGIKVR